MYNLPLIDLTLTKLKYFVSFIVPHNYSIRIDYSTVRIRSVRIEKYPRYFQIFLLISSRSVTSVSILFNNIHQKFINFNLSFLNHRNIAQNIVNMNKGLLCLFTKIENRY